MYSYKNRKKEEAAHWNNYLVHADGRIMDASGKEKHIDKLGRIKIILNGKVTFRNAKCIVYEAFTGESARKVVINQKDPKYYGLDGLIITPRAKFCAEQANKRRSLTLEQENLIREEREKPFELTLVNGEKKHYKKTSMNYLAKKYGVSQSTICHILKKPVYTDKEGEP